MKIFLGSLTNFFMFSLSWGIKLEGARAPNMKCFLLSSTCLIYLKSGKFFFIVGISGPQSVIIISFFSGILFCFSFAGGIIGDKV